MTDFSENVNGHLCLKKEVRLNLNHHQKMCWIDFRFSGIDPQLHAGHFAGRSMYASAILDSDVDKDMTLRLSFDDWFKVWVNGQLVGTWQNDSNFETIRIPVQLKKGRNEFLLKSNNIGHEWNSWVANFVLE